MAFPADWVRLGTAGGSGRSYESFSLNLKRSKAGLRSQARPIPAQPELVWPTASRLAIRPKGRRHEGAGRYAMGRLPLR